MEDKELLSLAAKAAGMTFVYGFDKSPAYKTTPYCDHPDDERSWNPLTSDGDALRLAVKLRLHIGLEINCVSAWESDKFGNFQTENFNAHGEEGATRRAIVRAAAKIGIDKSNA